MALETFWKRANKNSSFNQPLRRKNIYYTPQKRESLPNFTNVKTHKKIDAQNLNGDPKTVMKPANDDYNRLQGGAVQQEAFFDCVACECEQGQGSTLQQQLQIVEVIDKIKNPKEFKRLLKQMVYTSNVLYRTFRQAYNKTKKCKQGLRQDCYKGDQKETCNNGDINPLEINNVKSPVEGLEEVGFEQLSMEKPTNEKFRHLSHCSKCKHSSCLACMPGAQCKTMIKEKICAKCLGAIIDVTDNEKYSQTPLETEKSKYFCETELEQMSLSVLAQTCPHSNSETPKHSKQVLDVNPVCVSIPLKLLINGQDGKSRFMETEVRQFDSLIRSHDCVRKSTKSDEVLSKAAKAEKLERKSDNDIFYSCISNSGIIKPIDTQKVLCEKSFNEMLHIMTKFVLHPLEKKFESKGVQNSPPEILASPMSSDHLRGTDFTQTTEAVEPISAQSHLRKKANYLRSELLEEAKAALEKRTPKEALKALVQGNRFSLPVNLKPKEVANAKLTRHSSPSYKTANTTLLRPFPIQPSAVIKNEVLMKPKLPPKPTMTARPGYSLTETAHTDINSTDHFDGDMRRNEIHQELKELLEENPAKPSTIYEPEERNEILLDLHKLFHPQKAGTLPVQISFENALEDIRYLLEPDAYAQETEASTSTSKASVSQESILQNVKRILNPNFTQNSSKKIKYSKNVEENILKDLDILLTPRRKKVAQNQEIRASVLQDLRFMLDTREETTWPQRSPTSEDLQNIEPGFSTAQQIRHERQERTSNEIRDSVIADLRYLLDYNNTTQSSSNLENNLATSRKVSKKANVSDTNISSEE